MEILTHQIWNFLFYYFLCQAIRLLKVRHDELMSPVSPVFYAVVAVRIGLKTQLEWNIHSIEFLFKTLKLHISTSVLGAQHPNAG